MKTMTKTRQFERNKGATARRRMSRYDFENQVLEAIRRGERPAEAAPGVPMTDFWFEILQGRARGLPEYR